ncbi:MAG: hypothetical protein ACE5K1_09165 [Acidiferrobacterales bacterium]
MRKIASLLALLVFFATLSSPALAAKKKDKPGWEGWDRWNVDVGVFSAKQDTVLRLDATDGTVGTEIDFENNLNLDAREETPRIDVLWRYKKRSSLSLNYFKLEREGVGPLSVTLRWGDVVFDPVSTSSVRSKYDIEVISAQWGYTFFRTRKWDARFTLGIFAMDIFAAIQDPADPVSSDQGDVLAPLPVIGMGFDHKLTGKWHLQGRFNYFNIEAEDEYKGTLTETNINATHHTFKNVGFGIGYSAMNLDVDSTDKDFSGFLNIKYKGPFAYVRVRLRPGG